MFVKLQEPPSERPKGHNSSDETFEIIQKWAESNEFCPDGTIPIRRTTEKDILRASSLKTFGRKIRGVRHDTMNGGHEVSLVFLQEHTHLGLYFDTGYQRVVLNVQILLLSVPSP